MSLTLKLLLLAVFIFCMILMGSNLKKKKKQVLFFGDSLTEFGTRPGGYIALLNDKVREIDAVEKVELINSGRGGDKVYDLYMRINQDVLLREPRIVVLFVGVNDVWHKQKHGTGTGLDTFKKFYEGLITQMQAANIKLIICTPAIIGESAADNEFEWRELAAYGQVIKELAATYNIPVADLHNAFKNYYIEHNTANADEGILTTDGVHLNMEGNKLVAEEIWKLLHHYL